MSNESTPNENASVFSMAMGNLSFLLSVIRCGEELSEAEESNVRSTIERLREEERRLMDGPRTSSRSIEWRPISTAPTGKDLLLYCVNGDGIITGSVHPVDHRYGYKHDSGTFWNGHGYFPLQWCTHWMPLPKPPERQKRVAEVPQFGDSLENLKAIKTDDPQLSKLIAVAVEEIEHLKRTQIRLVSFMEEVSIRIGGIRKGV